MPNMLPGTTRVGHTFQCSQHRECSKCSPAQIAPYGLHHAWRPPGAQSGSLSVSIPRYYGPAHTSGLPQTPGSEEPLSFLPQPQTTNCHTPAVAGLTPLMIGGVSGISTSLTSAVGGITSLRIGGVSGASTSLTSAVGGLTPLMIGGVSGISTNLTSAVGGITSLRIGGVSDASTSLTSAVGGIAPLMIGGVAGRARDPQVPDRAPLGGVQSPRALVPGVLQAGPLTGLQHCPPPPHYSTGLLSHSAVPARLEEHQFVAQLATGNRKGTKRAATGPSPASPPVGKKKKKGGKKASKPKKTKAANPRKKGRSGAVNDSDLFCHDAASRGQTRLVGWGPPSTDFPRASTGNPTHRDLGSAAGSTGGPGSLIPHDYGSAAGSAGGPGSFIPHDYGSAAGGPRQPHTTRLWLRHRLCRRARQPYTPWLRLRRRFFRRASSRLLSPHTGPQQHWEHRPGKSFSRHRHTPCPRRFLPSRRAPFSRRHPNQTGPLYRDRPPPTGRVVGDLGGTVPGGAGGYPRPDTPQRGGRSPAPPLSERFLRSPAGRCRAAAPRLTALQIGGWTRPGHPPLPLISSGNTNVLPGELTKEHCPHWSVRSCSSPGTWTSSWPPRNCPRRFSFWANTSPKETLWGVNSSVRRTKVGLT